MEILQKVFEKKKHVFDPKTGNFLFFSNLFLNFMYIAGKARGVQVDVKLLSLHMSVEIVLLVHELLSCHHKLVKAKLQIKSNPSEDFFFIFNLLL